MRSIPNIPPAVARKLGYYVYLYVNPLDDAVFYVGKGKRGRALAHLDADEKREISHRIQEIQSAGAEPKIEILAHALPDADSALRIEAAAIDLLGLDNLANAVRGRHATKFGRMRIDELVAHYTRRRATIKEPAILIRINRTYRYGISEAELYDATRSAWKVGEHRREKAKLAFSVFEDVVREVYRIERWFQVASTFNSRFKAGRAPQRDDRWEFVGTVADEGIRKRYVNRFVGHFFTQGAQNPISYVNVD
jgi:hypothetical protein